MVTENNMLLKIFNSDQFLNVLLTERVFKNFTEGTSLYIPLTCKTFTCTFQTQRGLPDLCEYLAHT